jgi:hypothetical protein
MTNQPPVGSKALNGTQTAAKHLKTLEYWIVNVTLTELVDLVNPRTGKLNREKTSTAIGFPKKNLTDLKSITGQRFLAFEAERVLGKFKEENNKFQPKSIDKSAAQRAWDESEVPKLQQRIIELESQLATLQGRFGRFSELAEVTDELAGM